MEFILIVLIMSSILFGIGYYIINKKKAGILQVVLTILLTLDFMYFFKKYNCIIAGKLEIRNIFFELSKYNIEAIILIVLFIVTMIITLNNIIHYRFMNRNKSNKE